MQTPIAEMKKNAQKAETFLKLMANAKRLMILCHLGQESLTVNELAKRVGLSQSALSQHLAKMRHEKLVVCDKQGRAITYKIAMPEAQALLSTLYLIFCRK